MEVKIKRTDIIWSYIGQILYSGVNVLILPFVLTMLSSEELGLWYTLTAIGALAMLIDFGFSTTFTRNIAYSWSGYNIVLDSEEKEGKNHNYFSNMVFSSKRIYFLMSITVLTLLLIFGTPYLIGVAYEQFSISQIVIPGMIYFFAIFLNIYFAYWTPLLKGTGFVKEYYQIMVVSKIIRLAISILGLLLGFGIVAVSFGYFVSLLVMRLFCSLMYRYKLSKKDIFKNLKENKPTLDESKNLFKKLWPSVYKQGVISMSNYLTDRSSILVISATLGLVISANYGITIQILSIVTTISNVFYNVHIASVISDKANNNNSEAYRKITASLGIQVIIILISITLLLFFGNYLLNLVGSSALLIKKEQFILLGFYAILFNFQLVSSNFIIMDNLFPMVKAYFFSGIMTILMGITSILLFPKFGLWNILLSQTLVLICYNAWKWPKYLSKIYDKSFCKFIKDAIINGFKAMTNMLKIRK